MKKWLLGFLCLALGLMLTPQVKAASVARDGLGDVLIFPAYYAEGMAKSKIIVVNTSSTDSVVAKVVIRRASDSKETLDFFVYLSPNDYFEGEIYCVGTTCYFTSNDDSWLVGNCQKPSPPYALVTGEPVGYVEVIEAWSADLEIKHPTAKQICESYNAWKGNEDTTINSLMGLMTIYWPGEKLAYDAVAVKDYNNTLKLTIATETILDKDIIGPLFSKGEFLVPYDQGDGVDLLVVNFITRKATHALTRYKFKWYDTEEGTCLPPGCDISPCEEREEICYPTNEVQFISLIPDCTSEDFNPTKGWVRVRLTDIECAPKEEPAIGLLVRARNGQFAIADPAWRGATEEGGDENETCTDPGQDTCSTYTDRDTCVANGCGWAAGSPGTCYSCSQATTSSLCGSLEGCAWDDTKNTCEPTCGK